MKFRDYSNYEVYENGRICSYYRKKFFKPKTEKNGFHQGNVAACCRNCFNRPRNNVFKGFEWRYI